MYIYTMKYYSAIRKNEIMPLPDTWMDFEIIILSEDKYHMISLTCGIYSMAQMNPPTKQKHTHRHRLRVPKKGWRGVECESGLSRCKLLYTG